MNKLSQCIVSHWLLVRGNVCSQAYTFLPPATEVSGSYCYRPQRSCGQGYVFTCVCDSVNKGGVCLSACWDITSPGSRHPLGADTPQEQTHPQQQTPPGSRLRHTVNERTVRILLECILVFTHVFLSVQWGTHVTINHDVLDLTVQGPTS